MASTAEPGAELGLPERPRLSISRPLHVARVTPMFARVTVVRGLNVERSLSGRGGASAGWSNEDRGALAGPWASGSTMTKSWTELLHARTRTTAAPTA